MADQAWVAAAVIGASEEEVSGDVASEAGASEAVLDLAADRVSAEAHESAADLELVDPGEFPRDRESVDRVDRAVVTLTDQVAPAASFHE